MRMYVGVTDFDWYSFLREQRFDEVNFWKPGSTPFKAIRENEMFLFKLHAPRNYIVGGGFFVRFSILPIFLAWDAFGMKNGTNTLRELNNSIQKYRKSIGGDSMNQSIGCIILTDPFFFDEKDWIPAPINWSNSIVQGKTYTTNDEIGAELYKQVTERLNSQAVRKSILPQDEPRFSKSITKHQLGQGAFKVAVTEAYQRRCAITGERTLPVLEAAHIMPCSENGPHDVTNGILLKSDFNTLFADGYITITDKLHIEVSPRLHTDYGNSEYYYGYNGKQLLITPQSPSEMPDKEFLHWHNKHVYLG
ncbi:MAG: HNH endonuclease [Christensenellales bacterium]|jgi:putative restriction endonuclease